MELRFFGTAPVSLVDGGEITVGIYHFRLKTERGFKCDNRAFVLAGTRQRDPEIQMSQRQTVEQAYRP